MAGANRLHWPRRGSLQIWPRKRARKVVPRIRNFAQATAPNLLGFIGYKAGMTHVQVRDNNPNTLTKGQVITIPVTIIDCPPLQPVAIRLYKKTQHGLKAVQDIKKDEKNKEDFDEVKLLVQTQPKKTDIGKKKPDMLELGVGGKTKEEKLTRAQELFAKEISINDVFDEGQLLDIHAVSKGKGFQGTVKRYGVKIRQHKSEKTKRGIGNLGPWTPKTVSFRIAQAGKMGYHQRTEYNKRLVKITKPEEVNQKGGILHYGNVNNDCVLIKGSIAGSAKRPIVLTTPQRPSKSKEQYEVIKISTTSKQGR